MPQGGSLGIDHLEFLICQQQRLNGQNKQSKDINGKYIGELAQKFLVKRNIFKVVSCMVSYKLIPINIFLI